VELLDPGTAVNAKKKLIDYCWNGLTIEEVNSADIKDLDSHSSIISRKESGINVVIYSDESTFARDMRVESKQSGKTFCASIIMQEAIKSRVFLNGDRNQVYNWISFPSLENLLRRKDDEAISELDNLQESGWLVVDDIYMTKFPVFGIDAFFLDRFENRLPTIFVFRYNVDKVIINEESVGVAISKVLRDSNTFFISLSK
jgi:hypothetical protein